MIRAYWDKLCVADGCFDVDWFRQLYNQIRLNNPNTKGVVDGADEKDTNYEASIGFDDKYSVWFDALLNTNLIPVMPGQSVDWLFRSHSFPVGGRMAEHCDHGHSLAVTLYLSECEGGELCVSNEDKVLIKPKTGRMVILKGETLHSVLPVLNGTRETIQLFIRYGVDNG